MVLFRYFSKEDICTSFWFLWRKIDLQKLVKRWTRDCVFERIGIFKQLGIFGFEDDFWIRRSSLRVISWLILSTEFSKTLTYWWDFEIRDHVRNHFRESRQVDRWLVDSKSDQDLHRHNHVVSLLLFQIHRGLIKWLLSGLELESGFYLIHVLQL